VIPTALFDKSFLQSINTDESVWFDHYFMPVVCPLFYVETLADLKKDNSKRPPEVEVMLIAERFPELNSSPSVHHERLCLNNLLGQRIPMDGRILRPEGRLVKSNGKIATTFSEALEAKAFHRWANREFSEIEHDIASAWRAQFANLDLSAIPKRLKSLGVNRQSCKTLQDAKNLADSIVNRSDQPFEQMKFALDTLQIPQEFYTRIHKNWRIRGCKPLGIYAPYAAYVLTLEVFFSVAMAADHISTDRASNWADICYLAYLPFSSFFVSSDKLHRLCAPYFLRTNQHFVWGIDFKEDLKKIDEYFKKFPRRVREKGLHAFAKFVPEGLSLAFPHVWDEYTNYPKSKESRLITPIKKDESLVNEFNSFKNAPALKSEEIDFEPEDIDALCLERRVHRRKGFWYQISKHVKVPA
jgi:hypothetical protein